MKRDYARWLIAHAFGAALAADNRDRHFILRETEFVTRCREAGFDTRTIRELLLLMLEAKAKLDAASPVAA